MVDLVERLAAGSRALDLGAGPGSFAFCRSDVCVVRLDLQAPSARKGGDYISGDAARMPFAARSFDLIISNHSLEHFLELDETVREIGRVIKPDGVLYVAVPDASTLTDRIYRWLGRGGGHVNPFRSPAEVIERIERLTGLVHRRTRVLFSGFSFLNAHNFVAPPPRRIALFAFGSEGFLAAGAWILRWVDQHCGTRWSRYGWSFYFGNIEPDGNGEPWINVCVRCGSGQSVAFLRAAGVASTAKTYRCPACGGFNFLTPELEYANRDLA